MMHVFQKLEMFFLGPKPTNSNKELNLMANVTVTRSKTKIDDDPHNFPPGTFVELVDNVTGNVDEGTIALVRSRAGGGTRFVNVVTGDSIPVCDEDCWEPLEPGDTITVQ